VRRGSLVLLDTNAIFLPFREALPLTTEVDRMLPGAELALPSSVRDELNRLVERGVPHAAAARAFAQRLRVVPSKGRGDRGVLEAAVRLRATVVTADGALADSLRRAGAAVLTPRDRSRLDLRLPRFGAAGPEGPRARRQPTKR
jgi:rRNA-processing protein FCF1